MPLVPRHDDIDDADHVSNIVYVRWMQDLAIEHSNSHGWDWQRYVDFGGIFVVKRHEIDYGYSVKLGDVVLGRTWIESMKAVSCVRRTEITVGTTMAINATTTWVMIKRDSGRPQRIPEEIQRLFLQPESA